MPQPSVFLKGKGAFKKAPSAKKQSAAHAALLL